MDLEYFEEVIEELSVDYGMNKSHISEYLKIILTSFPVDVEDFDLVSRCLARAVSERSSIYKYYNPYKPYSLRTTMKRAYNDEYGDRFNNDSNSLEATIREDEALASLRLISVQS